MPLSPRGRGELVLVVDDEAAIRGLTARTLSLFGYQTLVADCGSEALSKYLRYREKIALVITDLVMPDGDGLILIQGLLELNPILKIIALSGLDDATGDQYRNSGVQCFLRKPYTILMLVQTVDKVLGTRSGQMS